MARTKTLRGERIRPESSVAIAAGVVFNEIDGETVLLNTRDGTYYGLDKVGTRVWTLMHEFPRLGTVHEHLMDEYDVAPDRLWTDLMVLVTDLKAKGLLTLDGDGL